MMSFQLPADLDPETVLICTSCQMEYADRFKASVCAECGGQLMSIDGTLVEPVELAYCKDCARPFDAGGGAFCTECTGRRLGLSEVSPEEAARYYEESPARVEAELFDRSSILQTFETDNPYMQRLFQNELYGRVPDACRGLLSQLSTRHPDEKLLTAMRVRHGQAETGFLMITTHFLRYVKSGRLFTVLKKDELWPLNNGIETEGMLGPGVIRTITGHQFQIWGVRAKRFREFYLLAQLALSWEATEDETERQTLHDAAAVATVVSATGANSTHGLAAELASLAQLRDQGILSEDEFLAAKQKLLHS